MSAITCDNNADVYRVLTVSPRIASVALTATLRAVASGSASHRGDENSRDTGANWQTLLVPVTGARASPTLSVGDSTAELFRFFLSLGKRAGSAHSSDILHRPWHRKESGLYLHRDNSYSIEGPFAFLDPVC